ncbi:MAG: VOC family protein [Pseudomonadota bacterium]
MERMILNVATGDLAGSEAFWRGLLGLEAAFESDWFILLTGPAGIQIGLIAAGHEVVPAGVGGTPRGLYPTFVVADVEVAAETARGMGAEILEGPADTFYGQRRMLVRAPEGTVLDISSPTAPAPGA